MNDDELRQGFQDLRAEDRQRVPAFEGIMARARAEAPRTGLAFSTPAERRWHRPRRLAWGGGILAAAAAATLLLARLPSSSEARFVQAVEAFSADPAGGAWKSPTDGLLRMPGGDILSRTPTLATPDWSSTTRSDSRRYES